LWRATELAGLDPDDAEPAERSRLIDLSPELRFRHPIIRAAVYGSASAPARRHQRPADARDHLQTALGLFTSMGANAFARRARSELEAAGANPDALQTASSPLTARESQIASTAAVGYANQEIADRLFITTHTVEYHLKKVFRKLGIVSRRQLRDRVSGELN
jgi:DNA-binding CsgD family transcriptional regulator